MFGSPAAILSEDQHLAIGQNLQKNVSFNQHVTDFLTNGFRNGKGIVMRGSVLGEQEKKGQVKLLEFAISAFAERM